MAVETVKGFQRSSTYRQDLIYLHTPNVAATDHSRELLTNTLEEIYENKRKDHFIYYITNDCHACFCTGKRDQ